jgi:hypothetical protein
VIDKVVTYTGKDGSQKPAGSARQDMSWAVKTEFAFAYADGSLNEGMIFTSEKTALLELEYLREKFREYGVPEEYWPILMERTIETVASSWMHRSE